MAALQSRSSPETSRFSKFGEDLFAEKSVIQSFVLPQRRRRYFALLDTRLGRDKIKQAFAHFPDFDLRFATKIPQNQQRADDILRQLRERHALDDCYVWSDDSTLDGQVVSLQQALSRVVGHAPGTILLCIPGRLAYYEGEEQNWRLILER